MLTLRDIVFGVLACLAAYLAWLCLRLVWLRRKTDKGPRIEDSPPETIHSQILGGDSGLSFSSVHFDGSVAGQEQESPVQRPEPRLGRMTEPDGGEFGFDALLEMRHTRHVLDELHAEHEALKATVCALKDEVQALRAASQVSPVYGDAVLLARRGYEVDAIAERCGISIAEAQLVRALSADRKEEGGHE